MVKGKASSTRVLQSQCFPYWKPVVEPRKMTSGANILNYNLYTNAARTTVRGDGSGGTSTQATNGTNVTRTVYGRIPALQNAFVGSYSDAIIVTIVY